MDKLTIKQNVSSIEQVSSELIEKLYRLALDSNVEDLNSSFEMELQGNISAPAAYEDSVQYLRTKFSNLTINIPEGKYYVRLKDPVIRQYCIENYGDGTGMTASDAASVNTSLSFWGRNGFDSETKATVTSLDDFKYFTGTPAIGDYAITNFTNATEITFPPASFSYTGIYSKKVVVDCKNISKINYNGALFTCIDNNANVTSANHGTFSIIQNVEGITDWDDSLLPNQTDFTNIQLFNLWSNLLKIIFRDGITSTGDFFYGCRSLLYAEYPATITNVGSWVSLGLNGPNTNSWVIVIKATTPPTMYYIPNDNSYGNAGWGWHRFPLGIYVPDSAVNAYKSVTPLTIGSGTYEKQLGWVDEQIKALIKPLSELPQFYMEMGTVTQADIDRV